VFNTVRLFIGGKDTTDKRYITLRDSHVVKETGPNPVTIDLRLEVYDSSWNLLADTIFGEIKQEGAGHDQSANSSNNPTGLAIDSIYFLYTWDFDEDGWLKNLRGGPGLDQNEIGSCLKTHLHPGPQNLKGTMMQPGAQGLHSHLQKHVPHLFFLWLNLL